MRDATDGPTAFYHEGHRTLQDHFDSRRIADRLEQVTLHDHITPDDAEVIGRARLVFLVERSPYVPYREVEQPVPDWKRMEIFTDYLPRPRSDR
jgi:hypothetical protein